MTWGPDLGLKRPSGTQHWYSADVEAHLKVRLSLASEVG